MAVHNWTRVEGDIFHAFQRAWVGALQRALNTGMLRNEFYGLAEQHAGLSIPELLPCLPGPTGENAAPTSVSPPGADARRSLAIRHVSGHRLVPLLEIISPANKDRESSVEDFAAKVVSAIDAGIHVLVIDLFPPGKFDPHGMHSIIRQILEDSDEPYELPTAEPLMLASYVAGPRVEAFVEHLAIGQPLSPKPLFLRPDRYVNVPLENTYQDAFSSLPLFWRDVIEGKQPVTE